jgi:two-component sensor histidine kinase
MLWVSGRGRVVARGEDGKAHRVLNIVMDVTERRKAEKHIELLMREISHRSKNLLSVVQAIASQTARTAGTLSDFQETFGQRLQGLAASHDLLVQEEWRGAPLDDLARHQLALFAEAGGPRLALKGPAVMLTAQAAQAIGLALHELGTNATKHGAWSVPEGNVEIAWALGTAQDGEGRLTMKWVERGGPQVTAPSTKGFGHVVIESMVGQSTGGEVSMEFNPLGLTWMLSIPDQNLVLP